MGDKLTAEYVRRNFPECVAFADSVRKVFGNDVRMVFAHENGNQIGKHTIGDYEQIVSDLDLTPIMTKEELKNKNGNK